MDQTNAWLLSDDCKGPEAFLSNCPSLFFLKGKKILQYVLVLYWIIKKSGTDSLMMSFVKLSAFISSEWQKF